MAGILTSRGLLLHPEKLRNAPVHYIRHSILFVFELDRDSIMGIPLRQLRLEAIFFGTMHIARFGSRIPVGSPGVRTQDSGLQESEEAGKVLCRFHHTLLGQSKTARPGGQHHLYVPGRKMAKVRPKVALAAQRSLLLFVQLEPRGGLSVASGGLVYVCSISRMFPFMTWVLLQAYGAGSLEQVQWLPPYNGHTEECHRGYQVLSEHSGPRPSSCVGLALGALTDPDAGASLRRESLR
ncbi:hypothetical protein P170DRAFT_88817 [Aspergillus steynii IBT 23096]|uniref:Uncharacterized protein n=1 Tax=Aspergillus steynii IBT 23096 TaxID=1392250 RepID=A0A2I2GG49_9EURO|nr:uncharacterized protein P170DRAFT_88817 [Aspergillus steynii IBT 23096]PLB51820.1 hypothetical protein P170DRAFT_88817 [Aspergillus steynii IBT 23096]